MILMMMMMMMMMMVMVIFLCRRTVTLTATSPAFRFCLLSKPSSLQSCCLTKRRSTSTGSVSTSSALVQIQKNTTAHIKKSPSQSLQTHPVVIKVLIISSVVHVASDSGDGGLQSDRWTRGPEALRCDLESGTESRHHGVSDHQLTRSSMEAEEGVSDPP